MMMKIYSVTLLLDGFRAKKEHDWSRVFEIESTTSLSRLHSYIQDIVEFDNDHMYDFFVGKNYRDRRNALSDDGGTPFDAGDYSDIRFEDVIPQAGFKLFYHFDFGDDWIFRLKIGRKIINAEKGRKYPRLILKNGKILKQYAD